MSLKHNRKARVALLSIGSNTTLIIMKVVAGILSGSVSIISEAIHSSMDLLAAIIAFFSVRASSKPADEDHPYGHGKIENISGIIEGLLIMVAAILIVREAIHKIIAPTPIEQKWVAIFVMVVSAVTNWFVSRKLYKVAKEEDSIALEADALHLKTDVYTSLGVALGLGLVVLTGQNILDAVAAIIVGCIILKESVELCKKAMGPLLDARLSENEEEKIRIALLEYREKFIDFHQLRTRKSGKIKYIDFHLTVEKNLTVEESHELCEVLEGEIEALLSNTSVSIHIEPGEERRHYRNI